MIDIGQLPNWIQASVRIGYFVWAIGVAILALILVILSAFDIGDVSINTETAILIGIAIVAPIIPFAQQLALPGGTKVTLSSSRQNKLTATLREGTELSEIAIEEFDLDQIIEDDL